VLEFPSCTRNRAAQKCHVHANVRKRVIKHVDELIPPQNDYDAKVLAAAGEAILPALDYIKWKKKSLKVLIPCVRTLGIIGSAKAREMLESNYGKDTRWKLLQEICECPGINPLRVHQVAKVADSKLPSQFRGYFSDLDDLSPLSEWLSLSWKGFARNTGINDVVSVLKNLSLCRVLRLNETAELVDLNPLKQLKELHELNIGGCRNITDLSPLGGLVKLETIDFEDCSVSALSPLRSLAKLETIRASDCPITDISALATLENLRHVDLRGCPVADFSPLLEKPNLQEIVVREDQTKLLPKSLKDKMHVRVL